MFFKKKKQPLDKKKMFKAVPVKNKNVKVRKDFSGELQIFIPRRNEWWVRVLAKILLLPKGKTVTLDKIGAWVWRKCDGVRTVEDLLRMFCREFKLNEKEAEVSLITYLKTLMQRAIIGMVIRTKQKTENR
jgi:hypothetical protein